MPKLVGFFLIPLYTQFLTPEEYGVYALILAYSTLLSIFISFQLPASVARFYVEYQNDEIQLKTYLSTLLYTLVFVLVCICILIELNGPALLSVIYSNENLEYFPLFSLTTWAVLCNVIRDIPIGILRIKEKGKLFFLLSVFLTLFSIVLNIFEVVILKRKIYGFVEAMLISNIIGCVVFLYFTRDNYKLSYNISQLKRPLLYSLPIIPHAAAGYLFAYSDRLIQERYISLEAIGLYALALKFTMFLRMIIGSFNMAWTPHFFKEIHTNKEKQLLELKELIVTWYAIILLVIFGIGFYSKDVLLIMSKPAFEGAWIFAPILALALLFRGLYCFSSAGLFYDRKLVKYIPLITVIAGLVNIILNLVFLPKYGIFASAIIRLISYFITFLIAYLLSRKLFPLKWNRKAMTILSMQWLCMMMLGYYCNFFLAPINSFLVKTFIVITFLYLNTKLNYLPIYKVINTIKEVRKRYVS